MRLIESAGIPLTGLTKLLHRPRPCRSDRDRERLVLFRLQSLDSRRQHVPKCPFERELRILECERFKEELLRGVD